MHGIATAPHTIDNPQQASAFTPLSLPGEGHPAETSLPAPAVAHTPAPPKITPMRLLLLGTACAVMAAAYWGPGYVLGPRAPVSNQLAFRLDKPLLPGASTPTAPIPRPDQAPATADAQGAPTVTFTSPGTVPAPTSAQTTPPSAGLPVPATTPIAPATPAAEIPAPAPARQVAATPQTPTDPATQATQLVATPMSTEMQVEVLGIVTAMGAKMLQMSEDNAALRDQLRVVAGAYSARMDDLERRLSLAEARRALDALQPRTAAQPAGAPGADPSAGPRPTRAIAAAAPAVVELAPVPPAPQPVTRSDWRVQGGSPHMAVIAQPGGVVKAVSVGHVIDERLGKVQRIRQDGRNWIVEAENGSIRGGE